MNFIDCFKFLLVISFNVMNLLTLAQVIHAKGLARNVDLSNGKIDDGFYAATLVMPRIARVHRGQRLHSGDVGRQFSLDYSDTINMYEDLKTSDTFIDPVSTGNRETTLLSEIPSWRMSHRDQVYKKTTTMRPVHNQIPRPMMIIS